MISTHTFPPKNSGIGVCPSVVNYGSWHPKVKFHFEISRIPAGQRLSPPKRNDVGCVAYVSFCPCFAREPVDYVRSILLNATVTTVVFALNLSVRTVYLHQARSSQLDYLTASHAPKESIQSLTASSSPKSHHHHWHLL